MNDPKYQAWTSSAAYGDKLVATFNQVGFTKTAELLGIGFKKTAKEKHLKTETTVSKPEGAFVKPGKETKEDKAAEKSQDAIHKADATEVGEHLESSMPEGEKKDEKKEASKKVADHDSGTADEPAMQTEEVKIEENPMDKKPEDGAPPADIKDVKSEDPMGQT